MMILIISMRVGMMITMAMTDYGQVAAVANHCINVTSASIAAIWSKPQQLNATDYYFLQSVHLEVLMEHQH